MDTSRTSPIVLAAPGTADATAAGVKTVTRRLVKAGRPCRWKSGRTARVYRRDPRTGELPFGLVEIVSVRRERLGDITDEEVSREGFPGQNREWFLQMFADLHDGKVDEGTEVWRVEYRWLHALNYAGVCCSCGYDGDDETPCEGREDKTHCDHWWDGPEEVLHA